MINWEQYKWKTNSKRYMYPSLSFYFDREKKSSINECLLKKLLVFLEMLTKNAFLLHLMVQFLKFNHNLINHINKLVRITSLKNTNVSKEAEKEICNFLNIF